MSIWRYLKPCVHVSLSVKCCWLHAGYRVQGSTNQPQINGFYARSDQIQNGFPVYTKQGLVLHWQGSSVGQWIIADAIGSGVRASDTSPDGAVGPSTSGWQTWDGNQWALESTLHVTGRPATQTK